MANNGNNIIIAQGMSERQLKKVNMRHTRNESDPFAHQRQHYPSSFLKQKQEALKAGKDEKQITQVKKSDIKRKIHSSRQSSAVMSHTDYTFQPSRQTSIKTIQRIQNNSYLAGKCKNNTSLTNRDTNDSVLLKHYFQNQHNLAKAHIKAESKKIKKRYNW